MTFFDCVKNENILVQPMAHIKPFLTGASLNADGETYYDFQKQITTKYTCVIRADSGVVRYITDDASAVSPGAGERVFGIDDYPAELAFDGTWRFNADTGEFYQDTDIVAAQTLYKNTLEYNRRLRACTDAAFPLQSAVSFGTATTEQQNALTELQQYAIDIASIDLTAGPAVFPAMPGITL